MPYLPYTPDVEQIGEDEPELFAKIADVFTAMGEQVAGQEGRPMRVSHAKTTALLRGELIVADGLPPELAQGLAAAPGRYQAIVRLAQGPGEQLHDRISTHRGLAIKLRGVPGGSIPESAEPATQDFVLEAHSTAFINSTAGIFLANLRAGVSHAPSLSEGVKNAVSKTARATEAVLESVGLESKTLGFFGHPPVNPLSEAYFSQVPMRWGDHIGKVGVYPTEPTLDSLAELKIDNREDHDAFRDAVLAHFAERGAEFELRVQLAIDVEQNPIENASHEWPEKANPYRTVARLVLPPQPSWSPAQDAEADRLSFRPANSLAAHRPLGQVMRARLFVYGRLAEWRRQRDSLPIGRADAEPMPD